MMSTHLTFLRSSSTCSLYRSPAASDMGTGTILLKQLSMLEYAVYSGIWYATYTSYGTGMPWCQNQQAEARQQTAVVAHAYHGCDPNEARSPTRNDADILVRVLRLFALPVRVVVEVRHSLAQLLHSRGRRVPASGLSAQREVLG